MGYSTKIRIRKDYVRKDGTSSVYLQVLINRQKKVFPLDIYWPVDKFDDHSGKLRKRHPSDPDVDDYNVIIQDTVTKANQVFKKFRLSGKSLSMERFEKLFTNGSSNESLTQYIEKKSKERLRNEEISWSTWKNHQKTLTKLKAWKTDILFADLDEQWAHQFDGYMRRTINTRTNSNNTRWAVHKNIKTYLHLAAKDDIQFEDPYLFFKISLVESTWKALHERDVLKLWNEYHQTSIVNERLVLRRFLFSVTTGLRKSDLYRVHHSWLHEGVLTFIPQKTKKKNKRLSLPLSRLALSLFNDALTEKKSGLLFDDLEEQSSNRILKKIGKRLKIKENLHHHVGRHTFITLYLKFGGKIDTAKELAGHQEIKTTMGYNHISEERLKNEIGRVDQIIPFADYFGDPSESLAAESSHA